MKNQKKSRPVQTGGQSSNNVAGDSTRSFKQMTADQQRSALLAFLLLQDGVSNQEIHSGFGIGDPDALIDELRAAGHDIETFAIKVRGHPPRMFHVMVPQGFRGMI